MVVLQKIISSEPPTLNKILLSLPSSTRQSYNWLPAMVSFLGASFYSLFNNAFSVTNVIQCRMNGL